MSKRRPFAIITLTVLVSVLLTDCARRRQPETEPRERMEPPITDRTGDTAVDRRAEEERLAFERALNAIRDPIYFDFDRSDLRPEARETLNRKAQVLRDYPDIRVRIEGHCDERGTVEYNLALGERRAESARQYLIDLGIDPDRLTTVSYGEERPAVEGHNEAAWALNRRAEFVPLGV